MSKFKVGDRVRIKAGVTDEELMDIAYPVRERDGEFTVVAINDRSVRLNNGWCIRSSMLEHVDSVDITPIRTIDVGSRVRIVSPVSKHNGRVGTVVMFLRGSTFDYVVSFDNGDAIPFAASEVELYVEPDVVLEPHGAVHIDEARIKAWINDGRRYWVENKSMIDDNDDLPEWSRRSGDALVIVEPDGYARVYRLEAISRGERAEGEGR